MRKEKRKGHHQYVLFPGIQFVSQQDIEGGRYNEGFFKINLLK
jgi:hypothetical protein